MPMTGRERVAAVLGGGKPDRLPVEVGATEFTGVAAAAYGPLKAGLGVGHTVRQPFGSSNLLKVTQGSWGGAATLGVGWNLIRRENLSL